MLKLKPGNVFQKLNNMDKKQAYTWGGIVLVCFIAFLVLISFMGSEDDSSFDNYSTHGYDLAQMPFVSDEAEEYLLNNTYTDMKDNNASALYTPEDKAERQAEDAVAEEDEESEASSSSSGSGESMSNGYSGYGRGGRGGAGGGAGAATKVNSLGSASMSRGSGSGMNTTWGGGQPKGDFSPYKNQDKGSEITTAQLRTGNARRALSQFAQTSRATAGMKENRLGNAKKALMGGNIDGSEAFTNSGVDLEKLGDGVTLDTNAPISSSDLSGLGDKLNNAAKQKEKDGKKQEDDLAKMFLKGLVELSTTILKTAATEGLKLGFDAARTKANIALRPNADTTSKDATGKTDGK